MDYKLAKQLKDAGFKQDGNGKIMTSLQSSMEQYNGDFYVCRHHQETEGYEDCCECSDDGPCTEALLREDDVYLPTLSELIEACGDRFEFLNIDNVGCEISSIGWIAGEKSIVMIGDEIVYAVGKGKTPESAVAKLWLKLNQE